ncbi:MAG: FAD-dependent oxidoreductase [Actinomycetota bacterium]
MPSKTFRLAERDVPVILDVDVAVIGGGSAGLAAAITAAQAGVRTALVERYGFFGGNAVSAWVGTVCGLYKKADDGFDLVCRGFAERWADGLKTDGGGFGPIPYKESAVLLYVPWAYKWQADRWVTAESNLTPLLHATVTEVVRTGRTIDAVIVGSKRGPLAITAKMFVDASGDADVAFHAGCRVESGGPGQRQFPSMQFVMQNVDVQAAYAAGLDKLNELIATEGQTPAWDLSRSGGAVLPTFRPGEALGAMTRIGVDGHSPDMTDPFEATAAEIAGRAEAEKAGRFLKEHMPGFAESFFADTPTQLGVRETRRAMGDYVLTGDDVLGAARFDDAIACGAWPQEFHVEGKATEWKWLDPGAYYQVPFRSLVCAEVDNLLLAGRCISATHEALASTRVIAPSMAQGEAAGVAAALAAQKGLSARGVDVAEVQRILGERGAFLG